MSHKWTLLAIACTTVLKQGWGDPLTHQDSFHSEVQELKSQPLALEEENNDSEDFSAPSSSPSENSSTPSSSPRLSSPNKRNIPPLIELKGGYFFFSDSKMRKVYDKGGVDLQLSGSYPIWKWIQIYGSVEYLARHGRSLRGHQRTNLWEVPLSLGPKLVARVYKSIDYYLTIGPRYFFVHAHNHSSFVDKTISQNGIGGFVGTGFNFFPSRHFLIDVFGEYSYCRLHFHPSKKNVYGESAQVGGFAFGAGLGYAF